MASQDEINHQRELLDIYRRNLAHEIRRASRFGGESAAPIDITSGIYESRKQIRTIKAWLHQRGVAVEDELNDEPAGSGGSTAAPIVPQPLEQQAPAAHHAASPTATTTASTTAAPASAPKIPNWAIVVTNVIVFALGIAANVASGTFPDSWKEYLWISWPVAFVLLVISVCFAVWQNQRD